MPEFDGQHAVVMGLGRFGGGVGVTRFLAERGATVRVTDTAEADVLEQSLGELSDWIDQGKVTTALGGHDAADFATADLVVVNPAVKPGNPFVRAALESGVEVTTEINLLLPRLPDRRKTIAVTGTAGKSTTAAMIGHALQHLAQGTTTGVHVGGNLGGSLLPGLDRIGPEDWVVLELSSFMLHRMRGLRWSPHLAVVTNLAPNHLDWHGSMEAYAADKQLLLKHQRPEDHDVAVLGSALDEAAMRPAPGVKAHRPSEEDTADWGELALPGTHNRGNAALAAWTVASAWGVEPGEVWPALQAFPGLPHRLERVAEWVPPGGDPDRPIRAYNDSKATTPEAAMLAIGSFPRGTVHVILGGFDKGSDLSPLVELALRHAAGISVIGQTGPKIMALAEASGIQSRVEQHVNIEDAVNHVVKRIFPGQSVLLSPGCASWDQYENYEHRAKSFIESVVENMPINYSSD